MAYINVLQLANGLGIGGMEKTLQLYAKYLNKDIFSVVVAGWDQGGVREREIRQNGIEVYILGKCKKKLTELMKSKKIHILHIHQHATMDKAIVEAAIESGVRAIVGTNVFERFDRNVCDRIDVTLLISKLSAINYRRYLNMSWKDFWKKNRVLYNPIDLSEFALSQDPNYKSEVRRKFAIPDNALVVGSVRRPSPSKWGDLFFKMLPILTNRKPGVALAFKGLPREIRYRLDAMRLPNRKIFMEASLDVCEFYTLIDVLAYSSVIGESFGIVLAEAMACSTPIVCNSTPLRYNSQIEVVDHNLTGFIVYGKESFAEAVIELLENKNLRVIMGNNGRMKVIENYEVQKNTIQLEKIYIDVLRRKGLRVPEKVIDNYNEIRYFPSLEEVKSFEREYGRSLRMCYGKPSYADIYGYELFLRHGKIWKVVYAIHRLVERFKSDKGSIGG